MTGSGPSRTALAVAGGVVYAAGDPVLRNLVDPGVARFVRQMLRHSRSGLLGLIDTQIGRRIIRQVERWTIPGIIRHWNCRKQWLARVWETARGDGFETLVILGSGFDALSLRVAQTSGGAIRTIDVDHPASLAARRRALSTLDCPTHAFIEQDLSRAGIIRVLEPALPEASSVFLVIEGVLMYLEPQRVAELFGELARLKSRRLRVAFTFMDTSGNATPAFRPRSRLVDAWLRMRGEPFRSGLDPAGLADWLEALGFALSEFAETPESSQSTRHALRGECVAVAERVTEGRAR